MHLIHSIRKVTALVESRLNQGVELTTALLFYREIVKLNKNDHLGVRVNTRLNLSKPFPRELLGLKTKYRYNRFSGS